MLSARAHAALRLSGGFWQGLPPVLGAVLLASTAWELFEYMAGITGGESGYVADTILDYVMNVIGAAAGYGIARLLNPALSSSRWK